MLTFTIDLNNNYAVKIFNDTQTEPIIYQPYWPNSTPWSNESEASEWARLCILSIEDPVAPYAPAGPNLPPEPKPIV